MGRKGDKHLKEPIAFEMYASGNKTNQEICEQLDISLTTFLRWKSESKTPGEQMDEYDKSRRQKRNRLQRLRDLFDEQIEHVERLRPSARTKAAFDAVAAVGNMVVQHDKVELVLKRLLDARAGSVQQGEEEVKAVDAETIAALREQFGL